MSATATTAARPRPEHLPLLRALAGGPATGSALARRLGLPVRTAALRLDRLRRLGLAEPVAGAAGGRLGLPHRLTAAGLAALAAAPEAEAEAEAVLPAEEVARRRAIVDATFRRWAAEGQPGGDREYSRRLDVALGDAAGGLSAWERRHWRGERS